MLWALGYQRDLTAWLGPWGIGVWAQGGWDLQHSKPGDADACASFSGLLTPPSIHVALLSWESSKCPIFLITQYSGCGFAICVKEPLVQMLSISVLDFPWLPCGALDC